MAQKIPNTFKVMYAAGPAIDISNQLTNQRYQDLKTRKNLVGPTYSLRVFDENIDDVMLYTNSIICIDDNGFSSQTYDRFHKQTYKLNPSTSPFAFDSSQTILTKKRNSFILFLGNGFITKGADVVLDSLSYTPDINLEICGPYKHDAVFWKLYKGVIKRNSKIKLNGFVKIGSKKYFNIVRNVQWQIHNSAAEGCATSVATLLRAGIIPITNYETGIDNKDIGINIKSFEGDNVKSTVFALNKALDSSTTDVNNYMNSVYTNSNKFTRERFTNNFLEIALKITSSF
jgi:hypothetical protein